MKKVLKIVLAVALLLTAVAGFAACSSEEEDTGIQVALLTHSPETVRDDGSFNEGAWNGISNFLTSQGLPLTDGVHWQFFSPHAADDAVRLDLIEQAINWGADVLVLPGWQWANAATEAQTVFEDAVFIILDEVPAELNSNTIAVTFAEEAAGFLAGYAAVRDGFTELGFMGGISVAPVVRFGHGFLQGAEHAANQMGLEQGAITIMYHYLMQFHPGPEVVTAAGTWFVAGTEIIFAAAGGAGSSVMTAAEANNGFVIGVDSDQSHLSPTVVISAVKALNYAVYDILTAVANDTFQGGRHIVYDASLNGVGLSMGSSQLSTFNQTMHDSILSDLVAGRVSVSNSQDMDEILGMIDLVTVVIP